MTEKFKVLVANVDHTRALFARHFTETEGCWLWTGARDRDGYGKFQVSVTGENRQVYVRACLLADPVERRDSAG